MRYDIIRPLLTLESTKMVALGIFTVRLDYCNSLLYGTSSDNFRKLQVTQNALWPELYAKLREHVVPQNCAVNCIGYL